MRTRIRVGMRTGMGSGKQKKVLCFFLALVIAVCTGSMTYAEEEAGILPGEIEAVLPEPERYGEISAESTESESYGGIPGENAAPERYGEISAESTESESYGVIPEEDAASEQYEDTGAGAASEAGTAYEPEESPVLETDADLEIISIEETADVIPAGIETEGSDQTAGEYVVPEDGITYLEERTFCSGDAKNSAASRIFMRSTLMYEHCYGDQLDGESREIYDALVNSWAQGGTEGVEYRLKQPLPYSEENAALTFQNAEMAYCAFAYDYPEVFWLGNITVSIGRNSSNMLVSVLVSGKERYIGAKAEVAAFNQAVESAVLSVRSRLPEGADRYTIIKAIHDYICETAEYDTFYVNCRELYDTAHSAAGIFLKDRVVVCEGYAKAFKILCGRFGIECALIVGFAGEAHMWNYVKMDDGKWYLVDTTWDDQEDQIYDTYLLIGSLSYGFHNNLVMSERQSWTDFSGSGTKNFVLPILSSYKYEQIQHVWTEISRTEGTCRSYTTAEYRCEDCGITKTEIIGPETGHVWGPYVSNNDATWQKDGTKTAQCRYGCGTENTVTDTGSMLRSFIKVNVSSLRLKIKQSSSVVKVTLADRDKVVSWKSNKPSVASVNKKGKITAGKKTGKAVITISTLSGLKKQITVTVQKNDVQTTSITGLSKKVTLKKGGKLKLSPVIKPVTSLQKVTYASSNKKVATVTAKGVITARKAGTAKVTVKSGKKTFQVTVKVRK